jgi:hypothetical protein
MTPRLPLDVLVFCFATKVTNNPQFKRHTDSCFEWENGKMIDLCKFGTPITIVRPNIKRQFFSPRFFPFLQLPLSAVARRAGSSSHHFNLHSVIMQVVTDRLKSSGGGEKHMKKLYVEKKVGGW